MFGAFTRRPEGLIGQPFYGWLSYGDCSSQAASAAFALCRKTVENGLSGNSSRAN